MEYSQSVCALNNFLVIDKLKNLYENGMIYFHLDFMDYHYVENFGLKLDDIKWLKSQFPEAIFDAHCMCLYSDKLIKQLVDNNIDLISLPAKIFDEKLIKKNKSLHPKIKFGIMLESEDSVEKYWKSIELSDFIILMTIDKIGGVGQEFNSKLLSKIKEIKTINSNALIISDGGLRTHNIVEFIKAGVDVAVGGSIANNFPENYDNFMEYWKDINAT